MLNNTLPSELSDNDIILTEENASVFMLPKEWSMSVKFLGGVKDQGADGLCSAYALATMKENQERLQMGYKASFSPEFIYSLRADKSILGMSPKQSLQILKDVGILPARYWKNRYNDNLPQSALDIASKFKIEDFGRVLTPESLKVNLMRHGVCYLALPLHNLSEKFWRKDGEVSLRKAHAVVVIGWTKDAFIIQNSWGYSYGNKGTTLLPFTDWSFILEAWFAIDAKTAIKFKRSGKIIK